jgi:hypothetical protein
VNLREFFAHWAMVASLETIGRSAHSRLMRLAQSPEDAQRDALIKIVRLCQDTAQGRRFGLERVHTVDDFRHAVPIQSYEDMRPAIEREVATGTREIAPETPLMYARTSGTTGKPKYIPVTPTALRQAKSAQHAMAFVPHAALGCFAGRVLGLGGATTEETLARDVPAGAISGLIYQSMPRFMRAKYLVPPEVFSIEDYELKYLVMARLALAASDISTIATANPATILRLMNVIETHWDALVADVRGCGFHAMGDIPDAVAREIVPLLRAEPRGGQGNAEVRAAALGLLRRNGGVTLATLWPEIRAVVTWLGGGCAIAAEAVRKQLPNSARMVDGGYVSSELRGTIVVDIERNLALPLLGDVFFEFVPVEQWDAGVRDTKLVHELDEGRDYHIIVTTAAGLLRYHMNDVMRASTHIENTPSLGFIRKGRGVTNIVGEKISEDQIHGAVVGNVFPQPNFYIALADTPRAVYRLYLEQEDPILSIGVMAQLLDVKLCELNIEYAAKRGSGRLAVLEVKILKAGAGLAYHRHCVEIKGQREAQAKVRALQTIEEFDFDLTPFCIADARA